MRPWYIIGPILLAILVYAIVIQLAENISISNTGPEESEDEPRTNFPWE